MIECPNRPKKAMSATDGDILRSLKTQNLIRRFPKNQTSITTIDRLNLFQRHNCPSAARPDIKADVPKRGGETKGELMIPGGFSETDNKQIVRNDSRASEKHLTGLFDDPENY